jgi:hypothetical protein
MKTAFPLSLIDNRVLLEFSRADLDGCKRPIGSVVEDGIARSVMLSALLLCQIPPNLQVTTSLPSTRLRLVVIHQSLARINVFYNYSHNVCK